MKYKNLSRPGVRTTQTVNPQAVKRDIDELVRILDPESTPMLTIADYMGKGKAPKSKKMEVMQMNTFDPWDETTSTVIGTGAESRYMRITPLQKSRPTTNNSMYYYPQDQIYVSKTGQNLVVVMTPDACYQKSGADVPLTTGLTGNTTTRSAAGTIVVMNQDPSPIIDFQTSDFVFQGRTIWESQPVGGISRQQDVLFDVNYVEHKECILTMTDDQIRYNDMYGTIKDFNMQQKLTLSDFKKAIHYQLVFGERNWDLIEPNRPTIRTRGVVSSIKTNVMLYDPFQTDDFETLVSTFMDEQAFRHNPNGRKKIAYCGQKFLSNFSKSFKEYRRSDLSDYKPTPGLQVESYRWNGNSLSLIRDETFRQGTPHENWCMVVDPLESELCVALDFVHRDVTLANQRDKTWMWEWEGGIKHHREESSALLRTA